MNKFGNFKQFGYARTLHAINTIDDDGNSIVIPIGTLMLLLDLYEDGCIVEYFNDDGIRMDVDEYNYEDIEPVSEEEVKRIVEKNKKHKVIKNEEKFK